MFSRFFAQTSKGFVLNYRLPWLFSFTFLCAIVLAVELRDAQSGYFLACFSTPLFLAIFLRYSLRIKSSICAATLLVTSLVLGVVLRGFLAYYRAYVMKFDDLPAANNMGEVLRSGIPGIFIGLAVGMLSLGAYWLLTLLVKPAGRRDVFGQPNAK